MKNKFNSENGMAISGILYTLLILFLALLFGILGLITSGKTSLDKLKNDIYSKLNGMESYSGLVKAKYPNGTAVYFNPVTGKKCSDYTILNSKTGVKKGCLKWYAFNDEEDAEKINLILDHNTSTSAYWTTPQSTPDTDIGPLVLLEVLRVDTYLWEGVETRTDSYTGMGYSAEYKILYEGYRARLISAGEIAKITGNTSFNELTGSSDFYLDTNSTTTNSTTQGSNPYAWLFNYTAGCNSYGCDVFDESTIGYWTSSAVLGNQSYARAINNGKLASINSDTSNVGVRPVITIDKVLLQQ